MKISLIGSGSHQFGYGMLGDIFQSKVLAGSQISIMDIRADALAEVYKNVSDYIEQKDLKYSVSSTTNLAEALSDSDFVLISIEVGNRFSLWDEDWNIPLQYGIRQVYGENGGVGGLFHALRIIPQIINICEKAQEVCPDAHIFCYSNPLTAITTAVYRKFPNIKFYGMCHEVASLERYLPNILGTSYDDLLLRAAGLNHFSVLVEAKYKNSNKDAYPDILEKAPAFFEKEPGFSEAWKFIRKTGQLLETEGVRERFLSESVSSKPWSDRSLFKIILEKFKLLPITCDSHLGEYIPWAFDTVDHKGIVDFYEMYRYVLAQDEPNLESVKHEKAVKIIESIITGKEYEEEAVNLPNRNLIPGLPEDAIVEVPAIISKNGIVGVSIPNYPKSFVALLRNYVGVYDLTADAALKGSRELVIQAILVNPLITEVTKVDELVDLMLEKQKKWLAYIK